jgi:SAM-dependent methyltransferase
MSSRRHGASRARLQWLVATQPGLGRLAAADLRAAGADVEGVESDGRNDLIVFEGSELPDKRALALAEDVFAVVGVARTQENAHELARRLFDEPRWRAGADVARAHGVRVGMTTRFRVIARVRSERSFKRTELRDAMIEVVRRWRPRWRVHDPADLELWVLETRKGLFRAAVRISSADMRSRGGRVVEREGALRPTVAAALVRAAGKPAGLLFDPFCGSGTVLSEAARAGWRTAGSDAAPDAIRATEANLPGVSVTLADATDLPLADGQVAAVATNAPFGVQHVPRTGGRSLSDWWCAVLSELRRVVRPGGMIVILHPDDRVFRDAVRQTEGVYEIMRTSLRTLGRDAVIWTLRRD